jgi:hypothetical protein
MHGIQAHAESQESILKRSNNDTMAHSNARKGGGQK